MFSGAKFFRVFLGKRRFLSESCYFCDRNLFKILFVSNSGAVCISYMYVLGESEVWRCFHTTRGVSARRVFFLRGFPGRPSPWRYLPLVWQIGCLFGDGSGSRTFASARLRDRRVNGLSYIELPGLLMASRRDST